MDLFFAEYGAPEEDVSPNPPRIMLPEKAALLPNTGWPRYQELYKNAPFPQPNIVTRSYVDCIEASSISERGEDDRFAWILRRC